MSLVPTIPEAGKYGAALLIECRGPTDAELDQNIKAVTTSLDGANLNFFAPERGNVSILERSSRVRYLLGREKRFDSYGWRRSRSRYFGVD